MTPQKKRISQVVFRSIVIGLALGFAPNVHANPIAPTVVSGSATIATSGNTMTVTNTPGAIINWQQFNIGQSEVLKFIQQSAQSSVLNRVISQNPSQILGTLQSNGRVFLINPSGVMFGQGSIVNVNGLVASTLNISDSDFLLNRFNFIGSNSASVINKGEITTPLGGSVYLIGNSVSNEGVITSPKGEVILAAGNSVSLLDTGTPHVTVTLNAPDNQAVNLGQIVAEGGKVNIYGALLSQQGLISADSASLDAQGNIVLKASQSITLGQSSVTTANGPQGGKITAQASGGKTTVSGRVEATGSAGSGGSISLLGNEVALTGTARIDASGSAGGGTVLVGGDYQGKNAAVQNAQITYLAQGASIKADAVNSGEGGKVIVWADEATGAFGNISAKGGATGGNGGFVEVSGKEYLEFDAQVNTSAPFGNTGTLLLDPTDITIISGSNEPTSGSFTSGTFYGGSSPSNSTISWGSIETQLASNNVIIQTGSSGSGSGNITVSGSPNSASLTISHTAPWGTWNNTYTNTLYSSSNNLSLLAENAVNIYAPFGNAGSGAITIIAGWNGSSLTTPDLVTNYTAGKNINFYSSLSSQNGNIIANTGALTLKAADTILFVPGAANATPYPGTNSASIDMNTGALTLVANKIFLDASGAASNKRASIQTNGDQSFTIGRPGGEPYDGLYLLGANGDNIYGGQAEIRRFGGSGGQNFTFNNGSGLILRGGAGNGLVPAGLWTGSCDSGNCSANNADIDNYGSGNQTFAFSSGGSLELVGGSRGNNNGAWIESSTAQAISGNPTITLTGGGSGGAMVEGYLFENDAGIGSNVSQTINAASITMNGGAANYGGAWLSAPAQTINVTGNVSLTGGNAVGPSAVDHNGKPVITTGVAIGVDNENSTSHTLTLTIGGNLTLQGGEVNNYGGSPALIGGFRIPTTLTIDTTGSIDLNGAGAGRDQIGSYGGYGGSVHLHSTGGYVDLDRGFVGTGTTGTTHIEAYTTISQAVGGQVKSGGLVMKALGSINALGDLTASANDVELLSNHGNLNIGTINATGYALLYATDGAVTDTNSSSLNVTANHLEAWAKNGINLDTQVNSIVALNSTAGDIVLREADGASLYNVWNVGGTNLLSTASGTLTQATNNSGSTNTIGTGGVVNYGSWNVSGGQSSTSHANPRYTLISGGGMTEISMVSPRSSARLTDPWLYLLDNSGNTLAYNDDGGVGYGAMIRKNLSAGDYTVVAATYSTGVSYPYAMTIGNASASSIEVFGGSAPTTHTNPTTTPIDPCVLNPTLCADTTSSSSLTTIFPSNTTNLEISGATGDVTFDPNLKVAGGEITFTNAGQTTAGSEITKAEGEIKQAEVEIKTAKTPIEKAKAEVKKTEAEGKKAEAESRKAEAEAKKAEIEGKQAEGEGKKAEAAAKSAKTPEDKARAEKTAEASKAEAEGKKAEVIAKKSEAEAKKSEAEVKKAEIEEKTAKTPVEKAKAEVKKTEAEGKKAEAESRKAEAEAKKAEVEAKQAEGEAKGAKSAEKKVAEEKKNEFKKAEAEAKKAESETKKAEAEEKKGKLEAKSEKSEEKKAEAEKKLENKKAEEAVKKAEAQKKESEYKKAEAERQEAGIKSFGKLAVAAMSKDNLKAMLDVRHEYKTDALKSALTILDRNPAAADMPDCSAGASGACIQQPTAQIASTLPAPAIPQFSFLPQIQRKVAVVIGVNKYQDKTIPALEGAVPDANAVSKMFKENMGYETRVIHDGTKSEIVQAINKVAGEVGANDSVTIYYAGHGYEMEATKTGYWIPSDGSAKSPANWISSNDINKMLGNIKAKQVLLVSDSCFSGNLAKEQKVSTVQGSAEDILGKRSVLVMSSGGDEPVSDEGRDGHSVFAWHFMDKLKGINKYEQGSKLYEGIKTGVTADGFPQTPQYGASVTAGHSTGGDYLFEVRK